MFCFVCSLHDNETWPVMKGEIDIPISRDKSAYIDLGVKLNNSLVCV